MYRGFKVEDGTERDHYSKGLTFFWPAFSSCSKEASTAEGFAGSGLVFEIELPEPDTTGPGKVWPIAGDLENVSAYTGEREVLLTPYTQLYVTRPASASNSKIGCAAMSSVHTLSGIWDCAEDEGVYYVSHLKVPGQHSDKVVWFAHSRPGGHFSWAHVFLGTVQGAAVRGSFGDIPVASDRFSGALAVSFASSFQEMSKCEEGTSHSFAGKTWKKRHLHVEAGEFPTHLKHMPIAEDSADGVTGLWRSKESGALAYLGVHEGGALFWFNHMPDFSSANVFWGVKDEASGAYEGYFSDIILSTRFRYSGKLRVRVAGATITVEPVIGLFRTKTFVKG